MARSPLSRNRAFERLAIPLLIVLFVTVAVRQLRKVFHHHHDHRVERVVHERHGHDAHRHDHRHERRHERRRQHRDAVQRIEIDIES